MLRLSLGRAAAWLVPLAAAGLAAPSAHAAFPSSANGDAKADLVIGDNAAYAVATSTGGSFEGGANTGTWLLGWSTAARYKTLGDFNGDGRDDLLVAEASNNTYGVALSDGTRFGAPGTGIWKTGWSANAAVIRVGDFNGDGRDDLLVGDNNTYTVATSSGSSFEGGANTGTWLTGWSTAARFVGTGDFNGDGRDDLLIGEGSNNTYAVALSDGTKFGAPGTGNWKTGWSANAQFIGSGDVNGDGRDDLVVGDNASYVVATSTGGSFEGGANTGTWLTGWSTTARFKGLADVNGDGREDLVVGEASNNTYAVATSDGTRFGGAYTGTWKTGWSANAAFIGLTRGSRNVAYPTSYQYGGSNRVVDTPEDADAVIAALRAKSDADAPAVLAQLTPTDRTYVTARANATIPSSVTYGGANWKVDSQSDADRFVGGYRAAVSDAAAEQLRAALSVSEKETVDARMRMHLATTRTVRALPSQTVWYTTPTQKTQLTAAVAAAAGLPFADAPRVTDGSISHLAVSVAALTPEGSLSASVQSTSYGAIEQPTVQDTAMLGDGADGDLAQQFDAGSRGCTPVAVVYAIKSGVGVKYGETLHKVRFCWNRRRHRAGYGSQNTVTADWNLLGKSFDFAMSQGDKVLFKSPWGGYAEGAIHIENNVRISYTYYTPLGNKIKTVSDPLMRLFMGHYDSSWDDASRWE